MIRKNYIHDGKVGVYLGSGTGGPWNDIRHDSISLGTNSAWNNLFVRTARPGRGDVFTFDDPPVLLSVMDYNWYVAEPPFFTVGVYATNRQLNSLFEWQAATGWDAHARTGDAGLVDPGAGDYHLSAGSPARGAGRVGGVPGGEPVNVGAYLSDSDVIGIDPACR